MVSFCCVDFDLKMQFAVGGYAASWAGEEEIVDWLYNNHINTDGNGLLLVPALEIVQIPK